MSVTQRADLVWEATIDGPLAERLLRLPPVDGWPQRFLFRSPDSEKQYVIAIHCINDPLDWYWTCSCPSYLFGKDRYLQCKHMRLLGLHPVVREVHIVGELRARIVYERTRPTL